MELVAEELETLIDALTAWESKDFGNEIMFGLMGAMLVDKKDPIQKQKWEEEERTRKAAADTANKMRKETSMLLKAKLIQMKQSMAIKKLEQV